MIYRAESTNSDINQALDDCIDVIVRKIRKNKTKLSKQIKSGALDDLTAKLEPVAEEIDFDVVRTKTMSVKPQTVEEAILQMNMLGHQFYMFLNPDTNLINVVYHRRDGGYGVLEPNE